MMPVAQAPSMAANVPVLLKGKHFADATRAQNPGLGRLALVRKSISAAVNRQPRPTSPGDTQ